MKVSDHNLKTATAMDSQSFGCVCKKMNRDLGKALCFVINFPMESLEAEQRNPIQSNCKQLVLMRYTVLLGIDELRNLMYKYLGYIQIPASLDVWLFIS